MRGATTCRTVSTQVRAYFNPRTPCGVRQRATCQVVLARQISIHAPRTGCDMSRSPNCRNPDISIHAPRAGCDKIDEYICQLLRKISIHAPRAGCDIMRRTTFGFSKLFQSTHPVRGATMPMDKAVSAAQDFNPRTPCGVRPHARGIYKAVREISIHAPRAGCDINDGILSFFAIYFNPPAHRSAWRRYAQRGSDSYSQDCKSAGCPSPG